MLGDHHVAGKHIEQAVIYSFVYSLQTKQTGQVDRAKSFRLHPAGLHPHYARTCARHALLNSLPPAAHTLFSAFLQPELQEVGLVGSTTVSGGPVPALQLASHRLRVSLVASGQGHRTVVQAHCSSKKRRIAWLALTVVPAGYQRQLVLRQQSNSLLLEGGSGRPGSNVKVVGGQAREMTDRRGCQSGQAGRHVPCRGFWKGERHTVYVSCRTGVVEQQGIAGDSSYLQTAFGPGWAEHSPACPCPI